MSTSTLPSAAYLAALHAFAVLVARHQRKALRKNDENIAHVEAEVVGGRKFDKIVLKVTRKYTKATVLYFVERETGKIFGMKSNVAPNENRYFGRVENAHKWDWSGVSGKNLLDDTMIKTGFYADVDHYSEVGTPEATEAIAKAALEVTPEAGAFDVVMALNAGENVILVPA